MPITQSAIKRVRQNAVRHARLLPYKTKMKTVMRKVLEAAKEGKKDEIVKMMPEAFKAIDTAAKKGLIHKSNASRKKALIARMGAAK